MIINKSVLLLKSQIDQDDKYSTLLTCNGFNVKQVKTLTFQFKNSNVLKEKLKNDETYQGLLFSSPRCVQAVQLAVGTEREILNKWKTKNNYAVGEATYSDSLNKLGIKCEGKESGNAENLSKFILASELLSKQPFLFPHGNLKTDTLSRELGKEDISIEGVLVYDTIANPDIEKELLEATDNFNTIPEFIVFFSPSGLHSSIGFLRKSPDFGSAKLLAIGPVTELAMKEENLTVFGVTKNPKPQDVLDLILGI